MTTSFDDQDIWAGLDATPAPPERAIGPVLRTWDDVGNGDRLVDHAGDRIRWALDAEKWAVWTGKNWAIEGGATLIIGVAREVLDRLPLYEAQEYDDTPRVDEQGKPKPSMREDFRRFVGRQRMLTRLQAMTTVARSVQRIQVRMDDFDANQWLFNAANGVVDLRTGDLAPHHPDLMQLSLSGVPYDPNAKAPLFHAFLEKVMPDQDRRDYLGRVTGYTITGSTAEQAIFVHHGTGANGKSVFMRILRALVGTYGQAVPQTTLLAKPGDGIPNDVARMIGKRLLITSETGAGKRLDDELVKQLTGGEEISARFMRGEYFDFTPVGKIHLMTNHLPSLGGGHGTERRLQDIGWDVTIPAEEQDKTLADRIIAEEMPGVLAWAVRGCLDWQKKGLAVPESVRQKTAQHVYDSDYIAQWLDARTAKHDVSTVTETGVLYRDYCAWMQPTNVKPFTMKAFVEAVGDKGYQRGQDSHSRRSVYYGIALLPQTSWGTDEG